MSECLKCTTNPREDFQINKSATRVSSSTDPIVPGSLVTISGILTSNSWLVSDNALVCLYNDTTNTLLDSTTALVPAGGEVNFVLTFTMPGSDINIRISALWVDDFGLGEDCEDYQTFIVRIGQTGAPTNPDPDSSTMWMFIIGAVVLVLIMIVLLVRRKQG